MLAASFVVTVAGCGKQSSRPEAPRTTHVSRGTFSNGACALFVPVSCPENATCNPPPPLEVDCPKEMRDAGEPEPPARRPPGKEDWIRVRPHVGVFGGVCSLSGEYFCSPHGKPYECTKAPPSESLACEKIDKDAGYMAAARIASFVWKDGVGTCHRVPEMECAGSCNVPEGEIVPCP